MKSIVIVTALAAIAVASSASSGVVAATAATSSSVGASGCAPLLRLPAATPAGQTTLYGHIKSLTRKGARYEMRFDPALWLTGFTASRAALEDTGSSDVPNDYYILDDSHRALTYVVAATAHVTVITGLPGRGPCMSTTSVAKLAQLIRAGTGFGFWIRVSSKYPSPVVSLDQQYQP